MAISLHTHSWYSLLEGTSSLEALLERAAICGHAGLALTDTNNLYGAVQFFEKASEYGVRPLLGACLRQHRWRCVALIATPAGYHGLCRILSRLHINNEPNSSLTDLLAENADGLHVLVDDRAMAERLHEAFGERLWLEIVRPARSPREEQELLDFGRRLGLQPVASTAAHFAVPTDYHTFRLITAIRQKTLLERLPRQFTITSAHHLVSHDTLCERFRDLPQALQNIDILAQQLSSQVLSRDRVLPLPRVPRRFDADSYLSILCERGLRDRRLEQSAQARDRLRQELEVIQAASLAGYFLVVREIARYAQHKGYGMALRGSAGNSLVCFLLKITDVNPLRFELPMERFLHHARLELPDIDLDFDWKVRDDVIDYAFRRHGRAHTAMISSHLFLQPRSAFRESAKIHGLSNDQIGRLLSVLPVQIETSLEKVPGSSNALPVSAPPGFPLESERWPRILADARRLLGRPHHLSIHPGGIVITPGPIEDYVPLQRAPKGIIITQFEKDAIEAIGLVKIDLLGNRALSTVDEALRILPATCPSCCSMSLSIAQRQLPPEDDPATVALLQRGDTLGVNQLESPAMRHLLTKIQPRGLGDVIQSLALVRPGAASKGAKDAFVRRRRGLEPIRYLHPDLEPILCQTEGIMVYEDDTIYVVQALMGLSASEADGFRKRITKRGTEAEAMLLANELLEACRRRGISRAVALAVWEELEKFNYYTFCKSHAVSYGLIAWTAAYLKAHHPLCLWTAALNNNEGVYPRRVYVEAIKRSGLTLRLPCINRSAGLFTLEEGAIQVGLNAIFSLDQDFCAALLDDRQRRGAYRDLADFRRRLAPGPEALAALIRCGALDFTGRSRPVLFLEAGLQDRLEGTIDKTKARLFPDEFDLDWLPVDYATERRLRDEWDLLGFLVGPPLMSLFRPYLPRGLITSVDLRERVGKVVKIAGVVAASRHTEMVDGRLMQFVTLEDEWGLIEVALFPDTCSPVAYLTMGPYLAEGLIEEQYGVVALTARQFRVAFNPSAASTAQPISLL